MRCPFHHLPHAGKVVVVFTIHEPFRDYRDKNKATNGAHKTLGPDPHFTVLYLCAPNGGYPVCAPPQHALIPKAVVDEVEKVVNDDYKKLEVGSENGWQPKFNDAITLRHREGMPAMGGWVPVGGTIDRFRATMAALLDRHGFRWAATDGDGAECVRCVHCTGGLPRGVPGGDRVDFRRVRFTKSVAPIKANRALHYVLLRGLPAVEDAKTNGYHKASMQHFITAKMIAEANFAVTSRNVEAVKGIGKVCMHPQRASSRITLRPS